MAQLQIKQADSENCDKKEKKNSHINDPSS